MEKKRKMKQPNLFMAFTLKKQGKSKKVWKFPRIGLADPPPSSPCRLPLEIQENQRIQGSF